MHDCILYYVSKCKSQMKVIQMQFISPSMYACYAMKKNWLCQRIDYKKLKEMFSRKYLSNTAVNIPFPTLTPKQTSGVATGSIKNARKIRRKLDSRCCWQISPKAVWRAMIHTKCRDECTKQIPDARIGTRHTYRQLIGSEGGVPEMCIPSYLQYVIWYISQ